MTLVNVSVHARSPLFEALRPLLARFEGPGFPHVGELNALLDGSSAQVLSGGGRPIRFVAATQGEGAHGYEDGIFHEGRVPTRADSWHDLFNALVWLTFPRTKAALNARHMRAMAKQQAAGQTTRGALRDAATLFDECGIVIVGSDARLWDLLQAHQWRELFWQRRGDLMRHTRFFVFGHATYDQLRAPFPGLCAKVVYLSAQNALLGCPLAAQLAQIDAALSERWSSDEWYPRPRSLAALPLLGIPGVTRHSEDPRYYDDVRQFRPKR